MEKFKRGKIRVFIAAAAIILVSAAVFIVAIQIVMGAEEQKVIEQAKSFEAAVLSETSQQAADANLAEVSAAPEKSEAPDEASAEGASQQPISEDDAIGACMDVAKMFNIDTDKSDVTATMGDDYIVYCVNGRKTYPVKRWYVYSSDFSCYVDAISGDVLTFEAKSRNVGKFITLGEYENDTTGTTPEGSTADMYNSPNDKYIQTAVNMINSYVTDGRSIENVKIGATQFVWYNANQGFEPDVAGAMQVDCQVYMETGRCYSLSFWGAEEIIPKIFMSHPTKNACTWGYFYEDEAGDYPPDGMSYVEWYTAPGIESAQSTPPPSFAPPVN